MSDLDREWADAVQREIADALADLGYDVTVQGKRLLVYGESDVCTVLCSPTTVEALVRERAQARGTDG